MLPTKHVDELSGWGNYPVAPARLVRPERFRQLAPVEGQQIVRGMGRSYGDAALSTEGTVILTERLSRLLAFDPETGDLTAEAGATLADVLDFFVPQGWFIPVTPGTKYCSLGGCLAADVHGKNHHRDGTFSQHVVRATLILPDGRRTTISPEENSELFWATAGGMGLTGIIAQMTIRLTKVETAWMKVTHHKAQNIDMALRLLSDRSIDDRYSVAWIDCLAKNEKLGRSVVMTAHHVTKPDLPLKITNVLGPSKRRAKSIPFDFPRFALSPFTIKLFNNLFWAFNAGRKTFYAHYEQFFYPLDRIKHWNRMYGKRGFVQYQFVLPTETSLRGMRQILEQLSNTKRASFLAVLKRFGPEGPGLLSFPQEGFTLSLDIPFDDNLLPFLDSLDDIVSHHGGRQYLAKDSRLGPKLLPSMYPRLEEFQALQAHIDPDHHMESDLSRRLRITK
jgi:FAD/FMN-containing dehydrogenase